MNEERKKLLLDATAGIREEYIEEAATAKPVKTPWLRVAAIAAVLALVIAAAVMNITIMWYYAVGAVVLGIFVAYAAMNGFDKFKEAIEKLKEYKKV